MSEEQTHQNELIVSYLTIRKSIGYLGILLPIVLAIGLIIFGDISPVEDSISDYYHTIMRDLFVGTLCAVSLFLFSYKGYPGSMIILLPIWLQPEHWVLPFFRCMSMM